jgi:hypothetical protein
LPRECKESLSDVIEETWRQETVTGSEIRAGHRP